MKEKINAIYNEELYSFLENQNELSKIEKGERFCLICGIPISLSNIQMVIPFKDKAFEYVCNSTSCVECFHEKRK